MIVVNGAAGRIKKVIEEIQTVGQGAGKKNTVQIIAVSKTMPADKIQEVYGAGIRSFGENKVQEYLSKKDFLPKDVEWHFIGRLQTNKVKFLVEAAFQGQLALFQSLDRVELVREIEKQAARTGLKRLACLIQVNSSGETTKAGFQPHEVEGVVRALSVDSILDIQGLMTVGPNTEDRETVRSCFKSVRILRDELKEKFPAMGWKILSMGMSADYRIAVEEGSTLVRVGTAIFGGRG